MRDDLTALQLELQQRTTSDRTSVYKQSNSHLICSYNPFPFISTLHSLASRNTAPNHSHPTCAATLPRPRCTTRAPTKTTSSLQSPVRRSGTGRRTRLSLSRKSLTRSRSSSPTSQCSVKGKSECADSRLTIRLRHGAQGILDTASKGSLEGEFGTHKEEDVVAQILEKGSIIESEVRDSLASVLG